MLKRVMGIIDMLDLVLHLGKSLPRMPFIGLT